MRRTLFSPPDAKPAFTTLIDIAFLVLIFFLALPLKRLDGKLEAHLPKDEGFRETPTKPKEPVRIRVRARGADLVYEIGQHRAPSPQGLERTLRALGPDHVYEIHASEDVPWKAVVSVVDLLKGLSYEAVRFTGTRPPPPEVRRALPLPRPG